MTSAQTTPVRADLLRQPHHDGSALYVSNLEPRLGDTVTVRVRVPHESDVAARHVRLTPDAEPLFVDAVVDRVTEAEAWWRAEITCHNPVTGGYSRSTGDSSRRVTSVTPCGTAV